MRGLGSFIALVFCCVIPSQAAIENVVLVGRSNNAVEFKSDGARIRISVLTPEIVRIQATQDEAFKPALMVEEGFVKTDWPALDFSLNDLSDTVEISTASLKLHVTKAPFRIELLDGSGKPLLKTVAQGVALEKGTTFRCELTEQDHFFGFGYMRKCSDARGQTLTWTRSYRNDEATVPFFMNPRGYAFFSNNTWENDFDFTGSDAFKMTTESGDLDVFLMVGADFATLLDLYTDLTGKPQLVPKWSLGLEHRARYYDNAEDVLKTARLFREYNIPCEIMALEPGWEEKPYSMRWVWSPERFPDPVGMIRELKGMGYKFDLWESGAAPKQNLLNEDVREAWFAKRIPALAEWGVDMFKQDDPYPRGIQSVGMEDAVKSEGEVSDAGRQPGELITVANSFYTRTVFDAWRKQTGRRPVIQFHAYNASVGSQRWPYQWAGDFGTGWGLLNASLSGHPMVNADARRPYLDARHLDFFMSAGPVNDCWAYTIEPWNYSDRLLEGARMYASLRARLYPYLYSAMRHAHETGTPIMRPMVFNDPLDRATYRIGSQFFIGDSLLVATTVKLDEFGDHARVDEEEETPNYSARSTPVYLPRGTWIDYWTGREYVAKTNGWIDVAFPGNTGGPLLVREGGIIPMTVVKQFNEAAPDELITLDVYPSEQSETHRLYEDDGITFGYERGAFADTEFRSVRKGDTITVDIGAREGEYEGQPAKRDYLLKVHSLFAPESMRVNGEALPRQARDEILFNTAAKGWYYDAAMNKIIIKPRADWHFKQDGSSPAGTFPLTPAEEAVAFTADAATGSATQVEIRLNPDEQARVGNAAIIVCEPETEYVLADGESTVAVRVSICDRDGNIVPDANQQLIVSLDGSDKAPSHVTVANGGGEFVYTAPAEPGTAQLTVGGEGLASKTVTLNAAKGQLRIITNPAFKVPGPGKGKWLTKQFTFAVSVRDAEGHRLATQTPVKLEIRDYRDRELIEREALLDDGEAEFRNVKYETRPEKFIITATAPGLEPATIKAFENAWHIPDDYYEDPANKMGLNDYLLSSAAQGPHGEMNKP